MKNARKWGALAVLAGMFLLLLLASPSFAQSPTGNIRGEVTDPSNAVIPNASVTVTEVNTRRVIELTTGGEGMYVAALLLPGQYKIRVTAPGFTPAELEATVRAGQTTHANVQLQVGPTTAQVQIVAVEAAQVDTTRPTIDGVITGKQIDQLPLNARNFLELAALEPGVLIRDGGDIDPTKEKAYRTVGVVGRSGTATRVQIDGIDVTDETVGTTLSNLSDDAVSEFQLTRSSLDLSTSLTSSGAVNIVTRSGSNDIHGAFFYFYRNQDMGARVGYQPTELPFKRHQIGYRVGGPFIKDKLFWFSNMEKTRQDEQNVYASSVDFPNIPFGSSNNCVAGCSGAVPLDIRLVNQRVDWNVRPEMRVFYRFGYDDNKVSGGTIPVSPFSNINWTIVHSAGWDWTRGRFTHSVRFGYVNFNNRIISQSFGNFAFPTTPQAATYYLEVGDFVLGPNSLAPQETDQDNFQTKYDGTAVIGRHTLQYGLEVNRIILGGFANFAGPLSIFGTFNATTKAAVIARGANPQNPLEYPLTSFTTGPNNGFFNARPCHGYDYGCHKNTRIAWYIGDTFKMRRNLTLNIGTRWEYDTGYFSGDISRPSYMEFYGAGISENAKFPKNRFGPKFGFAWDPWSNGKTSIRGGFYLAYEMNIYNNILFDEFVFLPPGIGPDSYGESHIALPDGNPITPAVAGINVATLPATCQTATAITQLSTGRWSCLRNNPIGSILGVIGQLDATLKNAYATYSFDPTSGTPLLEINESDFGHIVGGSKFKIPYSTQWNIGIQREIAPGHVLSVDYIYNFGVGMPFLGIDLECRRCASTLNAAEAQLAINDALTTAGVPDIDSFIAAGGTMPDFGLANDSVYTGLTPSPSAPAGFLQTTGLLRLRTMMGGGFSKYKGIHATLRGTLKEHFKGVVKGMSYTGSYAWGVAEATNASGRSEFLNTALNKFTPNTEAYFGPTSLDRKHSWAVGAVLDVIGGVRLSQSWTFRTPAPINVYIPQIGLTGANTIFSTDINGDGNSGGGSPLVDVLPGLGIGQFGRRVNSWGDLNRIIGAYNANYAGHITPAGQALVDAGLITEAQLIALGAVSPSIPPVPEHNPWPFSNLFNVDLGISRPIHLNMIREGLTIEPWFQVFNLFNHTGLGRYGHAGAASSALGGQFGSLNYDYLAPGNQNTDCSGNCVDDLKAFRERNHATRLFQIGVRVSF